MRARPEFRPRFERRARPGGARAGGGVESLLRSTELSPREASALVQAWLTRDGVRFHPGRSRALRCLGGSLLAPCSGSQRSRGPRGRTWDCWVLPDRGCRHAGLSPLPLPLLPHVPPVSAAGALVSSGGLQSR